MLFTDASEEPDARGGRWLGAVLYLPDGQVKTFACRPDRDFLQALEPRQKQTVALEPVTLLVAYEQVSDEELVYVGDYHERPRREGSDVDVCFGGDISVSLVTV